MGHVRVQGEGGDDAVDLTVEHEHGLAVPCIDVGVVEPGRLETDVEGDQAEGESVGEGELPGVGLGGRVEPGCRAPLGPFPLPGFDQRVGFGAALRVDLEPPARRGSPGDVGETLRGQHERPILRLTLARRRGEGQGAAIRERCVVVGSGHAWSPW